VRLLCILPLWLAACSPGEAPKTASISGRIYLDIDNSSSYEKEPGIGNMLVRLYVGACGKKMFETRTPMKLASLYF